MDHQLRSRFSVFIVDEVGQNVAIRSDEGVQLRSDG